MDKKQFNRAAAKWSIARCEISILSGGIFPTFKSMIQENRRDRVYLASWQKELLRQHLDQSDLISNLDIELSPAELLMLSSSTFFDCTWRLLIPIFILTDLIPTNLEHIYCFGCANGGTISALKAAFDKCDLRLPHLNLYDSFSGLPAEREGVSTNSYWRQGNFAASRDVFEKTLDNLDIKSSEYTVYQGYFCDTLNKDLIQTGNLKPALYVDIDCDLYGSAYEVLDFMLTNKFATTGTYIGYDDWGDTQLWREGESRAHKEVSEKHSVKFKQCFSWGRSPVIRKLFRIL